MFNKKTGPVILKEDSDAERFIAEMTELAREAPESIRKEIDAQVKIANYGLAGEKNILFELKNSGLD
ncbi:MAG: hypothetical protein J6V01_01745, partial [Clostridia bacterium]|nr:hypothetical protein [Clostridia bacterium]